MSFISGNSQDSWQPAITSNTLLPSYWLNWRFFICAIWVLITASASLLLIRKYEDFFKSKHEQGRKTEATMYEDETWRPCLKGIHPAWLLAYRVLAFTVMLILVIVSVLVDGGNIYCYYTQWTCTLITFYFGLGIILSTYGCYQYHRRLSGEKVDNFEVNAEQGTMEKGLELRNERLDDRKTAGLWVYLFQITFQMNAGAVLLTDFVFWLIMVPFLSQKDYHLNVLVINMHSVNVVFLLGDTALNSLRFPLFRMAYFFLWTVVYVLFQWMLHACINIWWPYPFLDLSSSYAPLCYAYTMLWGIRFDDKAKAPSVVEMVPRRLPRHKQH
ncbi:hypothetical protein ACFE04_028035 [Oxalis oulophora]